jgi:hypothetical protein
MLIVFWIACGAIGYMTLERFGKGLAGALLGALLGPIGLVICWVMRDNAKLDEARGPPPADPSFPPGAKSLEQIAREQRDMRRL